jgi:hypothetical protein
MNAFLKAACVSALALCAAPFAAKSHPLNSAAPVASPVVKVHCWDDCHEAWRSHWRYGSEHTWHNRWRSHYRYGSFDGYDHERWYSHNRLGSYRRFCCRHDRDDDYYDRRY